MRNYTTTKVLASFTNDDLGLTSFVVESNHRAGGFGVSCRDDDAGEFLPIALHGIQTLDAAVAKAREFIRG